MEDFLFIATHAQGKIVEDNIFMVGAQAKEAVTRYGADRVINGSIGVLLDDEGQLALLPSVEEATRALTPEDVAPYAPIAGLPNFRADVPAYLYENITNRQPEQCIATAGATAALRICVWNFLEKGQHFITHDYFWSPYEGIARDSLRELKLFPTYVEDGGFNVAGALGAVEESLAVQKRALLLINTPCQNPTGISLSPSEARTLRQGLAALAEAHPDLPIVLLIDGAYWEFGDRQDNRDFLALFQDLPDNLLFCIAFTLSKSLTRYGLRTGGLVMSGSDRTRVSTVADTMITSIRTTWSNTNRMGQSIFSHIVRNPVLLNQLRREQDDFAKLCNSRGHGFIQEADAIGLAHTPYKGGFFVTLPLDHPEEVAARLAARNIFLVPMNKGLRIAFCSIPSHSIPGLAEKIADVL